MINRHERFMQFVNVHPGTACWNWAGGVSGNGYGQFWDGQRMIPAHRFLLPKPVPKGLLACHSCDNKLCVRPSHIFIGSYSDNMRDCRDKGRLTKTRSMARGGFRKLTDEQIIAIRQYKGGHGTNRRLGKLYGVSGAQIGRIRSFKSGPTGQATSI